MSKILTISEAASIALHGMIIVARSEVPVNVTKIAELTSTSRHHVAKIMQRLVKAGYLFSQRGPTGGFTIRKDASKINFLEIYETIEGKIELTECPNDKPICPFDKCIFNNLTRKLANDFREYLKKQVVLNYC